MLVMISYVLMKCRQLLGVELWAPALVSHTATTLDWHPFCTEIFQIIISVTDEKN